MLICQLALSMAPMQPPWLRAMWFTTCNGPVGTLLHLQNVCFPILLVVPSTTKCVNVHRAFSSQR